MYKQPSMSPQFWLHAAMVFLILAAGSMSCTAPKPEPSAYPREMVAMWEAKGIDYPKWFSLMQTGDEVVSGRTEVIAKPCHGYLIRAYAKAKLLMIDEAMQDFRAAKDANPECYAMYGHGILLAQTLGENGEEALALLVFRDLLHAGKRNPNVPEMYETFLARTGKRR